MTWAPNCSIYADHAPQNQTQYYHRLCEDINWVPNSDQMTPEQLFEEAANKMENLVGRISVKTKRDNAVWILFNSTGPEGQKTFWIDGERLEIKVQRDPKHGQCYTLRFTKLVRDLGIKNVRIVKT